MELFRVELIQIIAPGHALVKLAQTVNWDQFEEVFGQTYCPDNGRPAISTRLMVALHYLKYTHNLSDEDVVAGWVENHYWQFFSDMKWFEHEMPIHPSTMCRWRKRVGDEGAEQLLKQTIEAGFKLKAVKPHQLKRINVDTTVQEKEIRFPADARLYDRARQRLVVEAKKRDIQLRQNCNRLSKQLLFQQIRYAHAKQIKRAKRCARKLKTDLGRVIRDIERNCPHPDPDLDQLLDISARIHRQKRQENNKVYSVHSPEVSCISKGKAHKRYEFGCKVSVAATSKGGWFLGALAFKGNPYDGHTIANALDQVESIVKKPEHVFVDMGVRGHGCKKKLKTHVDKRRRCRTAKSLWRWMKRRAAIETGNGHLKREHRMDRNRLKGEEGDRINAILSAAGMNFVNLLKWVAGFLRLVFYWLFGCQRALFVLPII